MPTNLQVGIQLYSLDCFMNATASGVKLSGAVEGVGYVSWKPVPKFTPAPAYPYNNTLRTGSGYNYADRDYLMLVTPFNLTLDQKEMEKLILSKRVDGSTLVNLGQGASPLEVSPSGNVRVTVDNWSKKVDIHITDSISGGTRTQSLSYPFRNLGVVYPELLSGSINTAFNLPSAAEREKVYLLQQEEYSYLREGLSLAADVVYVAGIMTTLVDQTQSLLPTRTVFVAAINGTIVPTPYPAWPGWVSPRMAGYLGKFAKAGKGLSYVGLGITLGTAFHGGIKYSENPQDKYAIHPIKAGLDVIMGVFGVITVGPFSIVSMLYFGVDSFYPGGWEGFGKDEWRKDQQNPYRITNKL